MARLQTSASGRRIRSDQISFGFSGGFWPSSRPLFQAKRCLRHGVLLMKRGSPCSTSAFGYRLGVDRCRLWVAIPFLSHGADDEDESGQHRAALAGPVVAGYPASAGGVIRADQSLQLQLSLHHTRGLRSRDDVPHGAAPAHASGPAERRSLSLCFWWEGRPNRARIGHASGLLAVNGSESPLCRMQGTLPMEKPPEFNRHVLDFIDRRCSYH